jgi:hypothetical protein
MAALQSLAATLWNWRDEIARMWRFTKSNAITEGLHNKSIRCTDPVRQNGVRAAVTNKMEVISPGLRVLELPELPVAGASTLRIDLTRQFLFTSNRGLPPHVEKSQSRQPSPSRTTPE